MSIPLSQLPCVSGANTVKALEKAGWTKARQRGTSHVVMIKTGVAANISVPQHPELAKPLLKKLLQHAGLTADEFKALL